MTVYELSALLHPTVCEDAPRFGWEHLPAYQPEPECVHVAKGLIARGFTVLPEVVERTTGVLNEDDSCRDVLLDFGRWFRGEPDLAGAPKAFRGFLLAAAGEPV